MPKTNIQGGSKNRGPISVRIASKKDGMDLQCTVGEFCNELINQRLRREIAAETAPIRELIVAQAFAEANLPDQSRANSEYKDDPKGISK